MTLFTRFRGLPRQPNPYLGLRLVATFIGTNSEFRRYIGPRLRNLVQQITKNHKADVAACEHCGNSGNLESAHVRGRERNAIIDLVSSGYTANELITIDLAVFEEKFKTEHEPIERSILILCRPCHIKYDSIGQHGEKMATSSSPCLVKSNDLLPITLSPSDPANFKKELLVSKKAEILSYYSDGRIEVQPWNASRFSVFSNVMGNLRSRPEFRSGNWQSRGMVKVHVNVIKNA